LTGGWAIKSTVEPSVIKRARTATIREAANKRHEQGKICANMGKTTYTVPKIHFDLFLLADSHCVGVAAFMPELRLSCKRVISGN
jgi:hypothetical protein